MRAPISPGSVALAVLLLACGPHERLRGDSVVVDTALSDSAAALLAASSPPPATEAIVQEREGWRAFQQSLRHALPKHADSASAALEVYRQSNGLPFAFFVRGDAPASALRGLKTEEDEMSCGGPTATVFVQRMPRTHPLLETSPVIEIDSAGRELRRWPLWSDIDYWELVVGVRGDDLVTKYGSTGADGVYLRIRPDGAFRVSSEPPQPFPPEKWVEVEDSVFLRVQPRDDTPFYTYPSGVRPGPVGTWEPTGDSDLYVRTDSGPKRGAIAKAVSKRWSAGPRTIACPAGPAFEGMLCRGFPDGAAERRLAYPIPCT